MMKNAISYVYIFITACQDIINILKMSLILPEFIIIVHACKLD